VTNFQIVIKVKKLSKKVFFLQKNIVWSLVAKNKRGRPISDKWQRLKA